MDIELSDGGAIEHPDADGVTRRIDVHGNIEEIRTPEHNDYWEWKDLFNGTND